MWKKFVTKLLAVALPFVLFAPLQAVAGDSLLDEIIDRGTIKIGSTLQYPPQMYRDESGEPAGYDVELMKMLANDMHVELEVVDMDFPGLIPALLAGKVDMLSVGLVNTPERALALEFTDGYVPYSQVVVVQKNSAAESVSDLNREGMKVTALLGSTAENLAKAKFPNAEIVGLQQQEAMMEVASGRADGVVLEEYLAIPFVANNSTKVKVLNPNAPFADEWGTWAVRPGDYRFLQYLNNWIRYYRARGTIDAMYAAIIEPTFYK